MQESVESRKLRTRLGSYLSKVEEGLSFVVTRKGQAVAELRPVPRTQHAEPPPAQAAEQKADGGMSEPSAISGLGLACYHLPLVQAVAEVAVDAGPAEQGLPAEMNGTAVPAVKKRKPKAARQSARKKSTDRRTASKKKK